MKPQRVPEAFKPFLASWILVAFLIPCGASVAKSDLSVSGLVAHPVNFSMTQLRSLASKDISVTQISGHGPVKLACKGIPLAVLLAKASPRWGSKRNAALAHTLLISGADGYVVALSLGEIDQNYGSADPVIAVDCNAKPLTSPRLVVPGDKHAGRAVRDVTTIVVK